MYETIMNITMNLLYLGCLGFCAFHKCNLGQWCTTKGATSIQVTVKRSSKANPNLKISDPNVPDFVDEQNETSVA